MSTLHRITAVVSLAIAAGTLAAQQTPPPAAQRTGFEDIRQDWLRSSLTYLASDALGGRGTLDPGDMEAIHWIEGEFKKAGLQPPVHSADGSMSYLQPVPITQFQPDRAATSVTLHHGAETVVWKAPKAVASFKRSFDLTAGVVFAGYGITAPELGYDDYAGVDVRGKIVIVFDHEPQERNPQSVFNGTGATRYVNRGFKLMNAQHHGAAALIIADEPNRQHVSNAVRSANVGSGNALKVPIPMQSLTPDAMGTLPLIVLDDAGTAELFRGVGTTASAAEAAIDDTLRTHPFLLPDTTLTLHIRNQFERQGISYNVVGLLPGSDPKLAAETILTTAHHDHLGNQPCLPGETAASPTESEPCPRIWHGADDNGSGTIGVVALAKAFGANPARPRRSILFTAFTGEDRGLLGSYWMADHPVRSLATTRAVLNFDMIGRSEEPTAQTNGMYEMPADTHNLVNMVGTYYSPAFVQTILDANRSIGLTIDQSSDHVGSLASIARSDQYPFLLKGIPALMLGTGSHRDYHHTTDTVDKIEFPKMQRITRLGYLTLWRLADEPVPPAFVATPKP